MWKATGSVEDILRPLETAPPPFSPHKALSSDKSVLALLSLLWWMVLGAPHWPQWLASVDKALNGFSSNLIAPESPKDMTGLQNPLKSPAGESETLSLVFHRTDLWLLPLLSEEKHSKGKKKQTQGHLRPSQKQSESLDPTDKPAKPPPPPCCHDGGKVAHGLGTKFSPNSTLATVLSGGLSTSRLSSDSSYQQCPS